jgi:hypothetical protein
MADQPRGCIDADPQLGEDRPGSNIAQFRSQIKTNYLAGMFRTADYVVAGRDAEI